MPSQRHSEVMRAAGRPLPGGRPDRQAMRAVREVVTEGHVALTEVDVVMAVSRHIMRRVADLDEERLVIAGGDPVLAALLAPIEARAIRQVSEIQANMFTGI